MRLLEVNGTSLLGATHQEAVNSLRAAGNDIQLVVCKGYDKSSLIHSIGSAGGMSTGFNSSSRHGNVFLKSFKLDRNSSFVLPFRVENIGNWVRIKSKYIQFRS